MSMNPSLDIAFCADRNMLAALHVAAKSLLQNVAGIPRFTVLTDNLSEIDLDLLRETLDSLGKEYILQSFQLDARQFDGLPKLAGSYSTYFRLLIPDIVESQNCFYVDSDTLCLCNISSLLSFDLQESPLALVPEALIQNSVDLQLIEMLSVDAKSPYFNAGVSLINCKKWLSERIKDRCINFITKHQPKYWDQSALNFVLHGRIAILPSKFNVLTNVRANWPILRRPNCGKGCLLHFVDYPKPWSHMGRWVHPFGKQWWGEYRNTAHFKKNRHKPASVLWDSKTRIGYRKAFKDKVLFSLYERSLFQPKGVPV